MPSRTCQRQGRIWVDHQLGFSLTGGHMVFPPSVCHKRLKTSELLAAWGKIIVFKNCPKGASNASFKDYFC